MEMCVIVRRRTLGWMGGVEKKGVEVGVPPAGDKSNCNLGASAVSECDPNDALQLHLFTQR